MVRNGHWRPPRVGLVPAVACALILGLPAASATARPITLAPPGNSAVSQYVEVVPTDRGSGIAGNQGGGGPLTPGQTHRYDGLGAQGRTLVALVAATSPGSAPKSPTAAGVGASRRSVAAAGGAHRALSGVAVGGQGAPPLSTVLRAVAGGGSGGVGVLLPVLLAVSAGAVFATAIWRRRTRGS